MKGEINLIRALHSFSIHWKYIPPFHPLGSLHNAAIVTLSDGCTLPIIGRWVMALFAMAVWPTPLKKKRKKKNAKTRACVHYCRCKCAAIPIHRSCAFPWLHLPFPSLSMCFSPLCVPLLLHTTWWPVTSVASIVVYN